MKYILGAWCVITCYISPVWLTMIYLDLTGLIYQYDFSMDEGTAGIIGFGSLMLWIFVVLLPLILFFKKMYAVGRRHFLIAFGLAVVIVCVRLTMCQWDMVAFLTTPGGHLTDYFG